MEEGEPFQQLMGDSADMASGTGTWSFEVMAQVAMLNVFHRDKHAIPVLIPAEEFDEEIFTLFIISINSRISDANGTYMRDFGHQGKFPAVINHAKPFHYLLDSPQFAGIGFLHVDDTKAPRSEDFLVIPSCLNRYVSLPGGEVGPVGRVCNAAVTESGFEFIPVEFRHINSVMVGKASRRQISTISYQI